MKALVKFRLADGRNAQKTIEVQKNEPNHIVAELLKQDKRTNKYTYVNTIKCGRYLYDWKAEAYTSADVGCWDSTRGMWK